MTDFVFPAHPEADVHGLAARMSDAAVPDPAALLVRHPLRVFTATLLRQTLPQAVEAGLCAALPCRVYRVGDGQWQVCRRRPGHGGDHCAVGPDAERMDDRDARGTR